MLITRFHQMIRHRVVWAIIATGVSLAFLFSFTSVQGIGGGGNANSGNAAGNLFGKEVTQSRFRQAMFFELQLGQNRAETPEQSAELHQQTWRRLAILHAAETMGVTVSDQEIGEMLHAEKGFQSNGAFDRERYREFVQSRGVDIATFEEYLRQNLAIQKVLGVLESATWTAPSDLDRRLRNLTDLRRLEYLALNQAQFTGNVEVAAADVRAFFEANRDYFTIPERVSVAYVTFPYAAYAATNAPSDSEVQAYYDEHIEDYKEQATTNLFALPAPLDTVRTNIEVTLRNEAARFAAHEEATKFVMGLAPDRAGRHPTFAALAEARQLSVSTTALFTATERLPGLDVDDEFNRAAFNLIPNDPQFGFSDSIPGYKAVYVLALRERQEARVPEFDEVADAVRPLATHEARRKAFREWADELRTRIASDVGTSNSFRDVVQTMGYTVRTTDTFTVLQSLNTNLFNDAEFVVDPIIELEKGAISEAVTSDSRAFVVHQADRLAGSPADAYALRPQLMRTLQDYTARMVFADWGARLLNDAKLEDFMAAPTNDSPEESAPPPGS